MYLPAWLGHKSKEGEVVFNPCVDLFQGHPSIPFTVDGKLDHGHVGVGRSF